MSYRLVDAQVKVERKTRMLLSPSDLSCPKATINWSLISITCGVHIGHVISTNEQGHMHLVEEQDTTEVHKVKHNSCMNMCISHLNSKSNDGVAGGIDWSMCKHVQR